MDETTSQRRILGFGGILWIVVGLLGIVASRIADGINPLMIGGPLLLGAVLVGVAIKGWEPADKKVQDNPARGMSNREKHA